jgi:hypothetical protein
MSLLFLNWSFNSRHVILIFPFIVRPHLGCLLSSTSASICKPQLTQYPDFAHNLGPWGLTDGQ